MSTHPDGRQWIGYRIGTYLVDRAAKASGRTPADLVDVSTADIVKLAGVR